MTEIEGVKFESAKVIPPGAKLVFKVPPTTNQEQCARLSEKLAKHFDGHDVVVLRDCDLHAIEPQPVAHEVPGFHIDSGGGVALWTVEYGSWAAIQPGDFQLFDRRRVVGEGAIPCKWSDIKPEDFRTFGSVGEATHA